MKKAKPVVILLLKVLVSGGLIAYLLARIHIERFLQTFATAKFSYIFLAMIVYLFTQGLSALRWMALARPLGIKTPFKTILRYYLIGMFFNLFAPGTVGGDVSRVYYLMRDENEGAKGGAITTVHAAMSVLMDRAIGMVVLVWLGAAGLWLFPDYPVPHAARVATFLLALGFVAAGLLSPLLRWLLPEDGHHLVVKLRLAFHSYRTHWRALIVAMLISLLVHLIQAWMHVVMASALGLDLPFSYAIIVYPLVGTFAAIPISLNGLGLREGGYIVMLEAIGISSEKAIAFSILLFLVVAFDSLIGGVIFLLQRSEKPATLAERAS